MIRELSLVIFLVCVHTCSTLVEDRRKLSTHERIRADGYPSQYFDLITSDGYVLQVNRIPRGRKDFFDFRRRPIVFLQHGLQSSANAFLGIDVDNSLAAARTDVIRALTYWLGYVEILGPSDDGKSNLDDLVNAAATSDILPKNDLWDLISIIKQAMDEMSRAKAGINGAAVKQYAHYGQNIRDKSFRSYDHGILQNLFRYGSITPPEYDLSKITVDMTMHYTIGDILLDEQDVLAMAETIPNCKVRRVAREDFSHTDFVRARDSKELVYEYVIDDLKRRK
ncbi:unnamed protein product [Pieris brassicae]|uniref:Partial AB-hydrolase lipase domain-containing protein n=1 Tax=Pieris brassicae TaxID=7116 RepID=A0A9P0X244_PIEBR|nr:unnamed protein product [Pieris brassicae]